MCRASWRRSAGSSNSTCWRSASSSARRGPVWRWPWAKPAARPVHAAASRPSPSRKAAPRVFRAVIRNAVNGELISYAVSVIPTASKRLGSYPSLVGESQCHAATSSTKVALVADISTTELEAPESTPTKPPSSFRLLNTAIRLGGTERRAKS